MSYHVRPFEPNDLDQVKALFIELQNFEKTLLSDRVSGEEIFDKYWDELKENIQANQGQISVTEVDNQVTGFVAFYLEKDTLNTQQHLYITDLIVNTAYRNQGIASALMQAAEKYAQSHGVKIVRVGVLANNPAKAFYEHQDYQVEALELKKVIK